MRSEAGKVFSTIRVALTCKIEVLINVLLLYAFHILVRSNNTLHYLCICIHCVLCLVCYHIIFPFVSLVFYLYCVSELYHTLYQHTVFYCISYPILKKKKKKEKK